MENENENEFPEEEVEEKKEDTGISADLIRGHINTIILRTLSDGDKYGYEIIDSIETKSQGLYTIKQPTLYSALKRLEGQGYVTSYWGGSSGGGRRRYFSLTEQGKEFYLRNQQEWEFSRSIIDSLISFSAPVPTPVVEPVVEEVYEPIVEVEEEVAISEEQAYDSVEPEEETPVEEEPEENTSLTILREQEEEAETETETEPTDEEEDAPAPEKDYKEVIGKLYTNAIDMEDTEGIDENRTLPKAGPEQISGNIEFYNILEQAEYDGIKVRTSGVYKPKEVVEQEAPTAFFNKGKTMFFSALSTFAVIFVEWLILLATKNVSEVGFPFLFTVLGLGVIFIAVFAIIYVLGYGKNAIKHKNSSFLVISVVIFAIATLIIAAIAISKGSSLSEMKVLLAEIVFPILFATNVIVYALFYRLLRSKM